MPMAWVEPEDILTHKGVTIYHTYRHGEFGDGRMEYHYTTDIAENEPDFDIRDLSTYTPGKMHEEILILAIENGELTSPIECKALPAFNSHLQPLPQAETEMLYPQKPDDKRFTGSCYIRGDFGAAGSEYWAERFQICGDAISSDFEAQLNNIIQEQRSSGILRHRAAMLSFCLSNPEANLDNMHHDKVYAFKLMRDGYGFYFRCFPYYGDYNFYIFAVRFADGTKGGA